MGTRADFYLGRGKGAKWLGSIAYDGYHDSIPDSIKKAEDVDEYLEAVDKFLASKDDATRPEDGWPWPWEDSKTTDYAYAFDGDVVLASCFGRPWFNPVSNPKGKYGTRGRKAVFPNMTKVQNVRLDFGSGMMLVYAREE